MTSRPALMTCVLPEMVVPIAWCRSVADNTDSMSEMACYSKSTRKVGRAEDADRSGGRRGQ